MQNTIYCLERIYRLTHMPIRFLSETGEIVLFCRGCDQVGDPIMVSAKLRCKVMVSCTEMPSLVFDEEYIYGTMLSHFGIIIIGPICPKDIERKSLEQYARRYGLSPEGLPVKRRTPDELCAALAMLYYSATGKRIVEVDILSNSSAGNSVTENTTDRFENDIQDYALRLSENQEDRRFTFSDETRIMRQIRDGDVEAIRQRFTDATVTPLDEDKVGKFAKQPYKQFEYTAVTVIALASRAAMDGGLDSMNAYIMSDLYLQRLDMCKNQGEIIKLIMDVMIEYAEQVRRCRRERSELSYIDKCKNYIMSHLNRRFTVQEIAEKINLNRSYLSRRFMQIEGIGIQQYAQMKRVEAAANMLKFSDESIETIAYYLCFSSQSHFGRAFKEQMKTTPKKYRESNKLADFSSNKM